MSTLALALPDVSPARRSTLRLFALETRYEFIKLFRTRSFSLAVVGFPVMFYLVFGLANRGAQMNAMEVSKYLLAGYACSGMVSAALFGIGVGMASERAAGWLELKRASPMPPLAYLLAKCITAQAFGVIVVAVLILLATTAGGVHLAAPEAVKLLLMPLAAAVPFAAMSLLVALLVPANSAAGFVNLIYMPMSVMSGLWLPLSMLPHWMRAVAPSLPAYHLAQITLSIFGYQTGAASLTQHWLALLGFTLLCLGGCWAVWQRSEQDA